MQRVKPRTAPRKPPGPPSVHDARRGRQPGGPRKHLAPQTRLTIAFGGGQERLLGRGKADNGNSGLPPSEVRSEMPTVCYLQLSLRDSGITGLPSRRRCRCEPARLPVDAARFEAKRRALPERAEGRSGAIGRPLRKRWAWPVKCSFGNTSTDLVQPEPGRAHKKRGRTQKYGNRTDHRDSTGWTSS
jgi:hypothetical protein